MVTVTGWRQTIGVKRAALTGGILEKRWTPRQTIESLFASRSAAPGMGADVDEVAADAKASFALRRLMPHDRVALGLDCFLDEKFRAANSPPDSVRAFVPNRDLRAKWQSQAVEIW
ncbi:hypothetical protein GCM10011402_19220 [Paracoccus acridae]|uniref:Uncharacterized protein n=1 Tax=Paracoccus acridae TaxID=1795310 RepID=A0ABQ1VH70_9RHOB|nr:hypothetical protein [Paracoccus acridae]GGF67041.1 hypothetical protein GCM10011402_19220 [Paracoccus acridae]